MKLQEDDLILCTVTGIEGTVVLVKTESDQTGTITFSEIASGRIRNIREYVVPNKKIVCKVLRVSNNNIDLSLRRVNAKERNEIMSSYKQEQTIKSALNSILKDRAQEISDQILSKYKTLTEFIEKLRENESIIDEIIPNEFKEQIKKIAQKRKKNIEVKKIIKLKSLESDGIKKIKELFENDNPKIEIIYISAGIFQINVKDEDYKKANHVMNEFVLRIEKTAKKNFEEFSIEDKK